jgi:hypothetical protein
MLTGFYRSGSGSLTTKGKPGLFVSPKKICRSDNACIYRLRRVTPLRVSYTHPLSKEEEILPVSGGCPWPNFIESGRRFPRQNRTTQQPWSSAGFAGSRPASLRSAQKCFGLVPPAGKPKTKIFAAPKAHGSERSERAWLW